MMNQQDILKKIGSIIHELQDQQLYLSQTTNINLLELELFTANADFLIDHIEVLKKLNQQNTEVKVIDEPNADIMPLTNDLIIDEIFIDELESDKVEDLTVAVEEEVGNDVEKPFFDFSFVEEPTEMVFDFEKKAPEEEVFETSLSSEEIDLLESESRVLVGATQIVEEDTIIEEEEGPEPFLMVKEIEEEPILDNDLEEIAQEEHETIEIPVAIEAEQPVKAEAKLTLNEMLSAKKEQKSAIIRKGNSNLDLKTTISLNDKMIFIKDLFNGYNLAYSEAVEIINRFETFEAADNFLLKNYAKKNNWADKSDVVDRFYEYLNRKFGA